MLRNWLARIKSDSAKVRPIKQKNDMLKKDTARQQRVTSQHHDVVQKDKTNNHNEKTE